MKHTEIADFDDNENLTKLNIDWHEFEVDFDTYFNGGQGLTIKEWEQVWFAVNELCGDEYQIQSLDDKYKVGLIPEPTKEEQAQFEIAELKQYLADTDYISNKLIEAIDDAELQDLKEKYADTLAKRRETRARINQLGGE